jgi:hypothetical protein
MDQMGSQTEGETMQKRLAQACSMTVLTEPDPYIYGDGAITRALRTTFPWLFAKTGQPPEYDLLSVPGLKYLPKNKALLEQTMADIMTAIGLHNVEHLLVVTAGHSHTPIVQRLQDNATVRKAMRRIRGYEARPRINAPPLKSLVIGCMDYRLYERGRLDVAAASAFKAPLDGIGVMTVPGAAKDLREGERRGDLVVGLLEPLIKRGLGRVLLISHTDCGKYGGCAAFTDDRDERERLRHDLETASAFLCSKTGVKVDIGIAAVSGHRLERVDALT